MYFQLREVARRRHKIRELLKEQESLKQDLEHAKFLLMAQPESWSFDCKSRVIYSFKQKSKAIILSYLLLILKSM